MQQQELDSGWYVAHGTKTKGPLALSELLQGAMSGTWGDSCLAWRRPWRAWRPIETIREVQSLRRAQRSRGAGFSLERFAPAGLDQLRFHKSAAWIALATDDLETITMTLRAATEQTGAKSGLAHIAISPGGAFETRSAIGAGALPSLGGLVERSDPAIRASQFGASILNVPYTSAGTASAWRLGDREERFLAGLAVIPIYCGVGLAAVLEIGRTDHPFRQSDRALLSTLGRRASMKLARHRAANYA